MWHVSQLSNLERLKFENIIDMGLAWSAMMRVFEKASKKKEGSKEKLQFQIVNDTAEKVFNASSKDEFVKIHTEFCDWGTRNIIQAEKIRKGIVLTKKGTLASYGQIAKTLDVTLKVAVYYCHLPDYRKSEEICQWLNAAVDTAMMGELKKKDFTGRINPWPRSLKDVDKTTYFKIQELVRESIKREHGNSMTPPQWDDINWRKANE